MARRSLRCVAELNLHAVSAPGVWLPSREDVYVSVSMLGQYRNTCLYSSVFPILLCEKFRFEKTYFTALDPSDVARCMEDELVVIELLQLSEYTNGCVCLASIKTNARDFLYPYPSLAPTYSSTDRELLLDRTIAFPGISPKIEFNTKTVIKESYSPSIDALEDALELEKERRGRWKTRRSPVRRSRSASPGRRPESRSPSPVSWNRSWVEPDPHYSLPTKASVSRSRSISPRRSVDFDLSSTIDPRPPFVVRKLGSDLIGRTPGGGPDCHAKAKGKKLKKSLTYSTDDLVLDRSSYLRNSLYLDKVIRKPLTDPVPVYRSKYDDEDAEVAELTSRSSSLYRPRPRSASPLQYRPTFSARYGLRPYSPTYSPTYYSLLAERVRRRAEADRLLAKYAPLTSYYSALDRLRLSPYYDPTLYDLELSTSLAKSRSSNSLVHIDGGHYWTERATELGGRTHRELFASNLNKSYNRLYRNARLSRGSKR